jgi:hypothetical protein
MKEKGNSQRETALWILEIPERVQKLDLLELKELLLYARRKREDMGIFICRLIEANEHKENLDGNSPNSYPQEYLPDRIFEYWAERYSAGGLTCYNTDYLIKVLQNRIDDFNSNSEYLHIFKNNGYELFKKIDKQYTESSKIRRYSFIRAFLIEKGYLLDSKRKYQDFLNKYYLPGTGHKSVSDIYSKGKGNDRGNDFKFDEDLYDEHCRDLFIDIAQDFDPYKKLNYKSIKN